MSERQSVWEKPYCSGAAKSWVPEITVSAGAPRLYRREMSKSMSQTRPSSPRTTFWGLMSRWIMGGSWLWRRRRTRHRLRPICLAWASVIPPRAALSRVSPGMYSRRRQYMVSLS